MIAVAVVVLAQFAPPPAPEEKAEHARLLESRPNLVAPIVSLAVPVVGLFGWVLFGALFAIGGCGITGTCPPAVTSAAPYWLGGLGVLALLAVPGAVWLPLSIRQWVSATRAASEIEDRIAPIDAASADP